MITDPLILHLETATTVCSVALSRGDELLGLKELDAGFTHAENLHTFIEEVLQSAGVKTKELHAIALSAGPGSYTGLRIGSSTAKGLCFALGIPLITIGTLKLMAWETQQRNPGSDFYCAMIDAGRMEVYCSVFDRTLSEILPAVPKIIDEGSFGTFAAFPSIVFAGNGMPKSRRILSALPGSEFMDDLMPSAAFMPSLALNAYKTGAFAQMADFEPFYLKSFVAGKKKSPLL